MTWLSNFLVAALAGSSVVNSLPSVSPFVKRAGEEFDAYSMHGRAGEELDSYSMHGRAEPASLAGVFARENDGTCPAPFAIPGKTPKKNIWAGLTKDEVTTVLGYVHDPVSGLNLTAYDKKGLWDNYVYLVEQIMPNKTDALAYIDGKGTAPDRYARVAISFGATDQPYYEDYIVGPLPISNLTKAEPLTYYYNKGSSKQFNFRHDNSLRSVWKSQLCEGLQDITLDLLGTYINTTSATSALQAIDPLWEEDGRIIEWSQFRLNPDNVGIHSVSTLVPQGFYLKLDITGRDPAAWKLLGLYYAGVYYETADDLRAAMAKADFVRTEKVVVTQSLMTNRTGTPLPYDDEAPPVAYQSQKRWSVDKDQKYVKWMDFEFYWGFNKDIAVTLFDVKYKGERIFYELGLEEALAHYAGSDPKSSHTAFLDSYYGFGPYTYELVKGYDCPWNADYVDTALHMNGNTTTNFDSICFFESDAGFPLQRHTTSKMATVTKNIVFNMRFVSTIGNYDYAFTYSFLLDGSVEVNVRASGYIQATYYYGNEDYGYKIQKHLSGSMHDHVLTFKADLDIKGDKNTFETTSFVPATVKYPWDKTEMKTMKVERSYVTSEDDGKINWASNGASMYSVVNKDKPNVWGEYPGYRISPGHGTPVHSTVLESSIIKESGHFATHHLYVTKAKDTEKHLSHSANNMDSAYPIVDFSKFFDGENIEQEDIVLWFNLGMHHLPHTGDLPITLMSTAQSSVVFSPHNYLLSDPSRQTRQQIEIDLTGEKVTADHNGKKRGVCTASIVVDGDYSDYEGGSTESKMPRVSACSNC
ncbi:copper amine oxidase [Coprinellus micaceus]|uniref:Amine oxidase n=1 Tax=Coprinellus micaceus TaxID=71717 RepID=A0A4Y7SQM3_COPMI|nr:copper amine oxidase [Coprinellus micaceus]